jgi:hypothetical protein
MHFNMLKSIILDEKSVHLFCKLAKYKNVFIFNEGFCHEGKAGTFFFYHKYMCIVVQKTYANAQLCAIIVFGSKKIKYVFALIFI